MHFFLQHEKRLTKHESVHDFHKLLRMFFVKKVDGKCLMYYIFSKTFLFYVGVHLNIN